MGAGWSPGRWRQLLTPWQDMDDGHSAEGGQAVAELGGVAGVVDDEVQAGLADGLEDRGFLGLVVELVLAARGGGHERQARAIPIQRRPGLRWLAEAAGDAEPRERILGQEAFVGRGQ